MFFSVMIITLSFPFCHFWLAVMFINICSCGLCAWKHIHIINTTKWSIRGKNKTCYWKYLYTSSLATHVRWGESSTGPVCKLVPTVQQPHSEQAHLFPETICKSIPGLTRPIRAEPDPWLNIGLMIKYRLRAAAGQWKEKLGVVLTTGWGNKWIKTHRL